MSATKIDPAELHSAARRFSGTEQYHRLSHLPGHATDGVAYVAEAACAHWLVDAILSHQPACRRDPMLREMQFWTLRANDKGGAVLECARDTDDVAIVQQVEFTDFPFDESHRDFRIWVHAEGPVPVLMLPSEY